MFEHRIGPNQKIQWRNQVADDKSTLAAKAAYMREWTRRNNERINAERRAKRAEHPDKYRAREKATYDKNIDKRRAQKRADHARHAEAYNQTTREWNLKNREHVLERKRQYYTKNKEAVLAKVKSYREANAEKVAASQKVSREKRKVARPDYKRLDYEKHQERYRRKSIEWFEANRERAYSNGHTRRAREKGNGGKYTKEDIDRIFATQGGKCAACAKKFSKSLPFVRDHVIPIKLGGSNGPENISLLCDPCNGRKSAKHPDAWAAELGKLFV